MEHEKKFVKVGKNDAKMFISNERIDYDPFVALSDMHMVRKAFGIDYDSLKKTIDKIDPDLWLKIDSSATELEKKDSGTFNFDEYAQGFVEGVAAVWEQIKNKV